MFHNALSTLKLVTETFQTAEFPMASQRVEESHKGRIRSPKTLAFSTAAQKPKTIEKTVSKIRKEMLSIQVCILPNHLPVGYLLKSAGRPPTASSMISAPFLPNVSYSQLCFISAPQHFSLHSTIRILIIAIVDCQSLPLKCKLHEIGSIFNPFFFFCCSPSILSACDTTYYVVGSQYMFVE